MSGRLVQSSQTLRKGWDSVEREICFSLLCPPLASLYPTLTLFLLVSEAPMRRTKVHLKKPAHALGASLSEDDFASLVDLANSPLAVRSALRLQRWYRRRKFSSLVELTLLMSRKRVFVLEELLETEAKYVHALKSLVDRFVIPLVAMGAGS